LQLRQRNRYEKEDSLWGEKLSKDYTRRTSRREKEQLHLRTSRPTHGGKKGLNLKQIAGAIGKNIDIITALKESGHKLNKEQEKG